MHASVYAYVSFVVFFCKMLSKNVPKNKAALLLFFRLDRRVSQLYLPHCLPTLCLCDASHTFFKSIRQNKENKHIHTHAVNISLHVFVVSDSLLKHMFLFKEKKNYYLVLVGV